MIFYGTGAVWNQSTNKIMMRFPKEVDKDGKKIEGRYETEDPHEIAILKSGGFRHEGKEPEVKKETVIKEPVKIEPEEKKEEPKKIPETIEEKPVVIPSKLFGRK